jgi:glycosyltransferase involved in cell wall biosynthesis
MTNVVIVTYNYSGVETYCDELVDFVSSIPSMLVFKLVIESRKFSEFKIIKHKNYTEIHIPKVLTPEPINLEKYLSRCLNILDQHLSMKKSIFHLNYAMHYYIGIEAKKRYCAKIIYTVHFLPEYFYSPESSCGETQKPKMNIEKRVIDVADRIICVTNFSKSVLEDNFSINKEKLIVIQNGVGNIFDKTFHLHTNRKLMKQSLGFSSEEFIILFIGKLEYRKGIEPLIHAFLNISRNYQNIKLVVIGDGDMEVKLHCANRNQKNIIFLGNISRSVLINYYLIADIGVIPSIFEQCSYVALEMMKYEVPVVTTRTSGLQEIYTNESAILIPAANNYGGESIDNDEFVANIEFGIKTLIESPNLRKKIKRNSFERWKKKFTNEEMGKKTFLVYNAIDL